MRDKKGTKSVTNEVAKKDRAQYRCPDVVDELIALVNSIPPDRGLPHREQIRKEAKSYTKAIATTKELLQGVPPEFTGVPPDFIRKSGGIWGAYVHFRNLRRALRDLANLALVPEADHEFYLSLQRRAVEDPDYQEDLSDEDRTRIQKIKLRAQKAGRGRHLHDWGETAKEDIGPDVTFPNIPSYRVDLIIIHGEVKGDAWSRIKDLEEIKHLDRLRVCAYCLRLFWARQNNMVGCKTGCSTNNRMGLYREKRAEYEQARKKAREKKRRAAKAGAKRK